MSMVTRILLFLALSMTLFSERSFAVAIEKASSTDKVISSLQKMISAMESLEGFSADSEVIYYRQGVEDQRYRLTLFYKKGGNILINFSHPFPSVNVYYKTGDKELVGKPLAFIKPLKVSLSIYNTFAKTPSGQRIDQTDVKYFTTFLLNNIPLMQKEETAFDEDEKRVVVSFHALDYPEGKSVNKYTIIISKDQWFPIRIERHSLEGTPIEIAIVKKLVINPPLEDTFFIP